MQVLHHEQDGPTLPQPTDHPKDALEQTCLTSFGNGCQDAPRCCVAGIDSLAELRQQARELIGCRAHDRVEILVGQAAEDGPQGTDERTVRTVRRAAVGAATQDDHRLVNGGDPSYRLVDEAGGADARGAVDQQRA